MNNCNECKHKSVSHADLEVFVAMKERSDKRWATIVIILIALLFLTNLCWIIYENQFEEVVTEQTSIEAEQETDGGGDNYVVGGDIIGKAESQSNSQENDEPAT